MGMRVSKWMCLVLLVLGAPWARALTDCGEGGSGRATERTRSAAGVHRLGSFSAAAGLAEPSHLGESAVRHL